MREADWAGPTQMHKMSAKIQNCVGPWANSMAIATATSAARDTMMTGLAPVRSSTTPATNAPIAATTLAATPNITTSALLSP